MDPNQTAATLQPIQPILFWLIAALTGLCAIATVITQNIVRAATWLLFTLAGTSAVFFLLGADLVGVTQLLVYVGGTLVLVVFGVMLTAQGPFISMKTSGAEWAISVVAGMLLLAVLTTAVMSEHVQVGPPRVWTKRSIDAPGKARKEIIVPMVSEVWSFAPRLSRAEREAKAAKSHLAGGEQKQGNARPMGGGPMGGGPKGLEPPDGGKKGGDPGAKGDKGDKGDKGGGKGFMVIASPPPGAVTMKGRPDAEVNGPVSAPDPANSPQAVVLGQGFLGLGVGPAHRNTQNSLVRTSYLLPFEIVSVHLLVVLIGAAYLARAKRRRGGLS
jgi:NADH:ubiquinone oxidoreductase subunit 6 (subunit J)